MHVIPALALAPILKNETNDVLTLLVRLLTSKIFRPEEWN
jgi:hypothetical protein